MEILTHSGPKQFNIGDKIEVQTMDHRLWKKILHFITFRQSPVKKELYKVTQIDNKKVIIK